MDVLPTPALVLDAAVLDANMATMKAALHGSDVGLRPHTKVQKSPELAQLQIDDGAVGVTVATIWEAAAMLAHGIQDVLVANQVVGATKIAAAARLASRGRLALVVDDLNNVADLSAAAGAAGSELGILVDLDVGMARCGARSLAEAVELADAVAASPSLRLEGLQAYEGHCMLEPDPAERLRLASGAMDYAGEVAGAIRQRWPEATTMSGGGTGTYLITGRHPSITELQAGSYVYMDAFHGNLVPGFSVALTVLTTVMARHGDTLILDAGRKSIGIDFVPPPLQGFDYAARYFAEEHALFDTDGALDVKPGDTLRLVSGYAPTTVNLHDVIYTSRDGIVTDLWAVFPRGPSDHGFIESLGLP